MKRLSILPLAAVMLFSCAKEPVFEPLPDADLIPINLDGSISQVATKATAQGFVNGDAVGLFAVNYGEGNTVAGTLEASGNQANNVKYVFDETAFKWTPMRPVYYKDVNTHVDLYVYYPYQGSVSDIEASNYEVKKDQSTTATATALSGYEASDWLWGRATDITPTESKVSIPLSHKLSAVQVTLVKGTGFGEGEFESLSKSVILTSTTRKATLNFRTGEATPLGSPQLDGIVMCPQESGAFRAIVIPQSVAAGFKLFAITLNGISYSFTQDVIVTYQAGKQMNVNITLNKKTPSGDYELVLGSATIVDWTEDRNAHGGEARQYFVVTVDTPGTLGEIITTAGKNPAKIRNLKVTGTINDDDFYYMRDNMAILEAVNMKECETSHSAIPNDAFNGKSSLYFVALPEDLTVIGNSAFRDTHFSGALVLPSSLTTINESAFENCYLLSSLSLPSNLEYIGNSAFSGCSGISSTMVFPSSVRYIGRYAFCGCSGLYGSLVLPEALESLEEGAFFGCTGFTGDLRIPDKITRLDLGGGPSPFYGCNALQGHLDLNNVTYINTTNFPVFGTEYGDRSFTGELVIPEGVVELPQRGLNVNCTSIILPKTLKSIGSGSFSGCPIIGPLNIPEGVLQIGDDAFSNCTNITEVHLPSTLIHLGSHSFSNCYYIGKFVCDALEVPNTLSGAFDGVNKDNFTLEVPELSVSKYRADNVWGEFRRIAGHYDFSLSRSNFRALKGSDTRTFTLRAPANSSWRILEKPSWVSVVPSSGTGKMDVSITLEQMNASDVTSFEVNEGSFDNPNYATYEGRNGSVVFELEDYNYTFVLNVEQYNSDYSDGTVLNLQSSSIGSGINIVITGDGYDAKSIAKRIFINDAEAAYTHLFNIEPFKSYKEYFNVYAVTAMSADSGIGTINTIVDNKFGSTFTQSRILLSNPDAVFTWAKKADHAMDLTKSLVILLQNTSSYEGITYMYGDGSALACCPVSNQAYPYDFRGIIQHEAGGHGFGKLGDEYIYHNAFFQNCNCMDGCDHGEVFNQMKSLGWFRNLSLTGDADQVPWSHLIYHPQYSNYVDLFEGGYMHSRGVYRSEVTSCMNNNIPYYSAISRQAIVERIKYCAGEVFSLEDFYTHDDSSYGPATRASILTTQDMHYGVDPLFNRSTGFGPIYMGEHPNVK